jgi:hypothetical protein
MNTGRKKQGSGIGNVEIQNEAGVKKFAKNPPAPGQFKVNLSTNFNA